ncbi:stress-response A/B barrel domain-containing protein UP3 isoform X1 [Iris pallida]|uniref:Stress-response A/B barrel domain-containing protein UP3 isoform X1 n=1 Tax=Iris pallida TaxID=29817 RepID=A0AAX6IJ56_IRIPA|nr:stress-response A/B barrel domain-containing protein UP3 isoform X1 [Iris pallida]
MISCLFFAEERISTMEWRLCYCCRHTESAVGNATEDALATLKKLISDFRSIIVQATQGLNFNLKDYTYTHAQLYAFHQLMPLNYSEKAQSTRICGDSNSSQLPKRLF